ncbi:syntaxin-like [Pomacea canaliculata]|uniref:syntaxin-like n=1 Tax=Pomacea canaliculata TaxID=400727 RepID=UPI000D73E308|nr:syntaxin-like [Pomacea canaliculata]
MPVRDRLEELQSRRELLKTDKKEKMPGKKDENGGLNAFLGKSSIVDADLNDFRAKVTEVKKIQQDLTSSPFCEKSVLVRYESLVQDTTNYGVKIRQDIRKLEEDADKYTKAHSNDEGYKRVVKQQLNGLTTQLAIATNEFFKCQSDYADRMKNRLKRQLQAKGESEITEERMNEILGQDSYSVFTQNFISEVQDAEQTLRELEERHKDILALEKSVTEVNTLFKDLNLLVSQQGETLDNIERNIVDVEVTVQEGVKQLDKAKESQRKARRKKCCIFGILAVVVAIVVVIIVVVVVQNNK